MLYVIPLEYNINETDIAHDVVVAMYMFDIQRTNRETDGFVIVYRIRASYILCHKCNTNKVKNAMVTSVMCMCVIFSIQATHVYN